MATKISTNPKRAKDVTIITVDTKGERTMAKNTNTNTTAQEVITVTINANTEKAGYEIRFSGYPKATIKNELVALKFRYYPALGNAWIKKAEKVSDDALKGFVAKCLKQEYKVVCTTDGKPDTWINKFVKGATLNVQKEAKAVAKEEILKIKKQADESDAPNFNNQAVINAMIALLKESGYEVTKVKAPTSETPKAKETPKAEAKKETKPKAEKEPATKKTTAKAEAPKEEPKPKAEAKKELTAKAVPVSNNKKAVKAEKKLYVDGKEIARVF